MFELKRPLKEKPDKFPKFSSIKGVEGSLLMGSDICNIYNFLKANPRKAFVSRDVREALKLKQDDKHVGDSMRILSNKQFIFRFPILCRAIGMRGSYIYSFSERDAWQRFWKEVPQKILQILTEIYNSPRKIFNNAD